MKKQPHQDMTRKAAGKTTTVKKASSGKGKASSGKGKAPGGTKGGAPRRTAMAMAPASPATLAKLRNIVASYGKVPNPTNGTIVGPAVNSMGQFTLDVNTQFGRNYVVGDLLASWDINQTGIYVDNNP